MNKTELASVISKKLGVPATTVKNVIDAQIDAIRTTMTRGENVELRGFGTFSRVKRAAKTGYDMSRGKTIQIPEQYVPKMKFSPDVKGQMNKK